MAQELPPPEQLSARSMGEGVVDHRSSWVRRATSGDTDIFVKTYDYPSWTDRLRNWGKWTAPWRRSRAARECQALTWLSNHGFAAAKPLACLEWRRHGFLTRATLVTEKVAGQPAEQLLATSSAPDRRAIALAIGELVVALHRHGFRDRNLDLRNLLVTRRGRQITIAMIDSPRFRLVQPGHGEDRLSRQDWQRLLPQLARFEVADCAREALRRGIATY